MFQTMEGNAKPHRAAEMGVQTVESQADLLRSLQVVSDNIMRLAGKLRAQTDDLRHAEDTVSINEQNLLAKNLIGRLLAMPASQA
jgi:hypothetical protein